MLEQQISRFLKIPSSPEPPQGNPDSLQIFRASKKYYRYKLIQWLIKQIGGVFVLTYFLDIDQIVGGYMTDRFDFGRFVVTGPGFVKAVFEEAGLVIPFISYDTLFFWLAIFGITAYLIQLPYTFLLLSLDYKLRWYMLTDTSLRIREGVTSIREQTMTFKNIQNISIKQGPIQGLLGISDLLVQTAGGGSGGDDHDENSNDQQSLHTGYFRGVDNADAIRDLILGRLSMPAEVAPPAQTRQSLGQSSLVEAANALLSETKAVHEVVAQQ